MSTPSAELPHRPAPLRQRARPPLPAELAMVPWLGLLDPTEHARVVAALQVVEASPGDFVCKIGRQANYWFGVLDGLLKMSNDSSLGFAITFTGVPPGAWFGEGTLLKREVYRYNIQDFITYAPIANGINQAQNIGNRKGHGFELEADYSPSYNLRFLANYAYQQSIDNKTDADVGDAPNHQIYGRSEWTIASDWHFDSQVTWVGKQKRVLGDTRTANDDYTTIDVTVRKQNVWRGLDVALSVRNLFDADVTEPSPGPVVYIPKDFPMAGRSVYGELTYTF